MQRPGKYDFINIHDHGSDPEAGVFTVENIMVHEDRFPEELDGIAYSCGAHPWSIDDDSLDDHLKKIRKYIALDNVIGIGEAGFDRIRGAKPDLQEKAFTAQVEISEEVKVPLFIHCVKAWDELLKVHKEVDPDMKWIIHGFRGKPELAKQLLDKGFHLSPWVEWAIRPESTGTLSTVPLDRLFLETDGFDIEIESVYRVVAEHLDMGLDVLKKQIYSNFHNVFIPA